MLDLTATAGRTLVLVLAFVAASVAVYAINDMLDRDSDRRHPAKRLRPVASGAMSPRAALLLAAASAVLALLLASAGGLAGVAVVSGYLAISAAYTRWLKHVAVLDVVVVASGFVLRALLGAVGNGLPVSSWFLLVSLFGALYLVTAKRLAELVVSRGSVGRRVLSEYPADWLRQVVGVALTGTLLSYAMWAFQTPWHDVWVTALTLSVGPFLVALLRYGLLVARGEGERPEVLVLHDRPLLVAGLAWAALLAIGIYGA